MADLRTKRPKSPISLSTYTAWNLNFFVKKAQQNAEVRLQYFKYDIQISKFDLSQIQER